MAGGGRGINFLDLMFASVLAEGLAEAMKAGSENPPPENFISLPRDPQAWHQIRDASKKENMVVAVDIANNLNQESKRLQPMFVDLAREFEGIPFVRATIGPAGTFEELRESLGGVESTPTWLIVWYGDDKTFIAKWEGNLEIRQALAAGRIKAVIREFIQRRKRMKVAEHLALQLAGRLFLGMSLEERRARTEYEDKLGQLTDGDGEEKGKTASAGKAVTMGDLALLKTKLQPMSTLWHPLGTELGIDSDSLLGIAKAGGDSATCLSVVLTQWITSNKSSSTLEHLAKCVEKLGNKSLAQSLLSDKAKFGK